MAAIAKPVQNLGKLNNPENAYSTESKTELESRLWALESEILELRAWKEAVTSAAGAVNKGNGTASLWTPKKGSSHSRANSIQETMAKILGAYHKQAAGGSIQIKEVSGDSDSEDESDASSTTAVSEAGYQLNEKVLEYEAPPPAVEVPSAEAKEAMTNDILDVLASYGQHIDITGAPTSEWLGKAMFAAKVESQITKGEPIRMILPAFPWKSINRQDKVLGNLPDLGEFLALSRLHQLCEDIRNVYPKGAEIMLATDGLIFDDVVGISDHDTWAYSKTLVEMCEEHQFTGVKLLRVMDILDLVGDQRLTEELYLSLASQCRERVIADYGKTEEEVRQMMADDPDTLMTYKGFIRFLEKDLRHSPVAKDAKSGQAFRKIVKKVAINMMIRAESFTKLLQTNCPDFVRLSIHPSSGAVKLSVPLIKQADGRFPRSPWHSTCAMDIKGGFQMIHTEDARETHNIISQKGHPFYLREKSSLWDWEDNDKVVFEPRYPNTLLIHPADGESVRLTEEQKEKVLELNKVFEGRIEVSGFEEEFALPE